MQSIQALTPSSTGAPDGAGHQSTPANLSTVGPERAKPTLSSRWSAARTFTQNVPMSRIRGHVDDVRAGAKLTSGGSSDSEANDWHVKPSGRPSEPRAVTTTTPVAKWPSTSRSTAGLTAGALAGPVMVPRSRPTRAPPARRTGRVVAHEAAGHAPAVPGRPARVAGRPRCARRLRVPGRLRCAGRRKRHRRRPAGGDGDQPDPA